MSKESQGLVFYYEKAILTIQRLFTRKKLLQAYARFKQTLSSRNEHSDKRLIKLQNMYFHIMPMKDEKNSQYKILLWNINNYRLDTIDYTSYGREYSSHFTEVVDVLLIKQSFIKNRLF